ncbi:hypothetical protein FRX31_014093 [Thalictrum thalictroides]|uniref:Bifunctional inhibitor/plant lipid transfer protein/seed storage helical domain-containing protein n=1 Tax=Thalictrum thalictroides TaxID=46969 RepID=A0A7J6WFX7_THATH|nr:hypothetical protein FRX31_014093 [Thalictrum thalictroides]
MARLAISGALLVLLLALAAEASMYQTVVTTTEINEPNTSPSECQSQIMPGMRMDSCRRYFQPYMLLLTKLDRGQMRPQQLCCQELRQVSNPQCRCEAIKQIVQRIPGLGQGSQQPEMQEVMMRKMQDLSKRCGMEELQYCRIHQQVSSRVEACESTMQVRSSQINCTTDARWAAGADARRDDEEDTTTVRQERNG